MDDNTLFFTKPGHTATLKLPRESRFAVVQKTGIVVLEAFAKARKYPLAPDRIVNNPVYPLAVIVIPAAEAWKWAAVAPDHAARLIDTLQAQARATQQRAN